MTAASFTIYGLNIPTLKNPRDLWRIYVNTKESRTKFLTEGIDLRNTNDKVYDTNPYSAGTSNPFEKVLKITVKGVPLSVDNNEVMKMLQNFNLSFTNDLKYEHNRNPVTKK